MAKTRVCLRPQFGVSNEGEMKGGELGSNINKKYLFANYFPFLVSSTFSFQQDSGTPAHVIYSLTSPAYPGY